MAEEKKTVKKVEKKKNKKVETPKKETVKQEATKQEVKSEKPVRKKRTTIDRDERIPCRSTTKGELIYVSPRTGFKYTWYDFGAVEYLEMGELMTMRSASPAFLNDGYLIVEDEDAASQLRLEKVYEDLIGLDDLDEFFDLPLDEFEEALTKLPKGARDTVATYARELMENNKLDSRSKIQLIEDELKVDLKVLEN